MINSFIFNKESFLFSDFFGYSFISHIDFIYVFLQLIVFVISFYWFSSRTPYNFNSIINFLFSFFTIVLFFFFLEYFVFSGVNNYVLVYVLWLYLLVIIGGSVYFQKHYIYFEYFFFILSSFFFSLSVMFVDNLFFLFFLMESNVFMISILISTLDKTNTRSIEASFLYFIANSVIGLCLLMCISILYGYTGIINVSELHYIVTFFDSGFLDLVVIFMMLVLSFKIYSFPYNTWVPVLYRSMNVHLLLFLSTGYILPLYLVFYNFYINLFIYYSFSSIIAFIGAINMLFGFLSMISHLDLRSVLAYSSIFTTGFFMVVLSFDPSHKPILFIISYSIGIFCLFSIYHLIRISYGSHDSFVPAKTSTNGMLFSLESFYYFFNNIPVLGTFLYLIFFYIVGFPTFFLFFAKIHLIFSSLDGYFFSTLLLLAAILMSSLFYIPLIRFGIFRSRRSVLHGNRSYSYNSVYADSSYLGAFLFMLVVFTFINSNFFLFF